jgi:peroxiredoxin
MKSRFLPFVAICALLMSCSSKDKANTIISGLAAGYSGKTIYISKVLPSKRLLMDSALVDSLGNFAFRLTLKNPDFFEISARKNVGGIAFIASPSEQIEVTLSRGNDWAQASVKGSSGYSQIRLLADSLRAFKSRIARINAQFDTLKYSYRYDSIRRVLKVGFSNDVVGYRSFVRRFIVANKGSLSAIPALYQKIDSAEYVLNDKSDFKYFVLVDSVLYRKYPESAIVKALHARVETIRYQLNNQKLNKESVAEGSIAPEFVLKSLDGDTLSLSRFKGRYVLLTFWATWAKPSAAYNAGLAEVYKKYKPYGFEIIQVSLDRTADELNRGLTPDMRQWKHISEFKMWNSSLVKEYKVACIPSNFIINRQGVVVAKNVLGKSLYDTLRWFLVRPYLMKRDTTSALNNNKLNTSDL